MTVTLDEQETQINFQRTEDVAEIWTSDRTTMTRLHNLAAKSQAWTLKHTDRNRDGDLLSETWIAPKKLISFRSGVHTTKSDDNEI